MLCDPLKRWDAGSGREVQEGGDICIHVADSLCCTAETSVTLWGCYNPIKIFKKLKKLVKSNVNYAGDKPSRLREYWFVKTKI